MGLKKFYEFLSLDDALIKMSKFIDKDIEQEEFNKYMSEVGKFGYFKCNDETLFKPNNFLNDMSNNDKERLIKSISKECPNIIDITDDGFGTMIEYWNKKSIKKISSIFKNKEEPYYSFVSNYYKKCTDIIRNTYNKRIADKVDTLEFTLGDFQIVYHTIFKLIELRKCEIPFKSFKIIISEDENVTYDLSNLSLNNSLTIVYYHNKVPTVYHIQMTDEEIPRIRGIFNISDNVYVNYAFMISGLIDILYGMINELLHSKRKVIIKEKQNNVIDENWTGSKTKYRHSQAQVSRSNIYIKFSKEEATSEDIKLRRRLFTRYYKEQWSRRGHIRTYKDGREIFIKPTSCQRNKDLLKASTIHQDGTMEYIV